LKYFLYIIFINLVYYSIRTKDNNPKTNNHNMVCVREDENNSNNGYMTRLYYWYMTANNKDKNLCLIIGWVFAFMLVLVPVLVLKLTLVLTNSYSNSIHQKVPIVKYDIDVRNYEIFYFTKEWCDIGLTQKEFAKIIRDHVKRKIESFNSGYEFL
jgi:hypothetical protein